MTPSKPSDRDDQLYTVTYDPTASGVQTVLKKIHTNMGLVPFSTSYTPHMPLSLL